MPSAIERKVSFEQCRRHCHSIKPQSKSRRVLLKWLLPCAAESTDYQAVLFRRRTSLISATCRSNYFLQSRLSPVIAPKDFSDDVPKRCDSDCLDSYDNNAMTEPTSSDSNEPRGVRVFVTVAVCTRNRAGSLEAAVKSVIPQLTSETELLIIDNASTDDTPKMGEQFA